MKCVRATLDQMTTELAMRKPTIRVLLDVGWLLRLGFLANRSPSRGVSRELHGFGSAAEAAGASAHFRRGAIRLDDNAVEVCLTATFCNGSRFEGCAPSPSRDRDGSVVSHGPERVTGQGRYSGTDGRRLCPRVLEFSHVNYIRTPVYGLARRSIRGLPRTS